VVTRESIALFVLLGGCATARAPTATEATPGVVWPVHFAEGHGDGALAELPPASSAAPASSATPGALAPPKAFSSDPPDPPPLRQAQQYEYTFRYEQGKVSLVAVRAVRFAHPIVSARRIGRFAFELWIGRELVERVRFDFPLLGSDEPRTGPRPLHEPPAMVAGPFVVRVLVPAAARARTARLVDRATREQASLPWPPEPSQMGPLGEAAAVASVSPAPAPSAISPPSSSAPAAAPRAP
jgi:hypothetical protein